MDAFVGTACSRRTAERQQPLENASQDSTAELLAASLMKMLVARTLGKFGSSEYAFSSCTYACMVSLTLG